MRCRFILRLTLWLLATPLVSYAATENFANAWPTISAYTKWQVEICLVEERPYVKSGSKSDSYVGATRSLYGIPFNMSTESSLPLARDIENAVVKGYQNSGMEASTGPSTSCENRRASADGARLVMISIKEWMVDRYASAGFSYDIQAEVYDHAGRLLGSHSVADSKTVESPVDAGRQALRDLLGNSIITTALAKPNAAPDAAPPPSTNRTVAETTSDAKSGGINPISQRDEATRLGKLKALRDQNLISQQEYERKRKEILDAL